jgi:hypothetical protein
MGNDPDGAARERVSDSDRDKGVAELLQHVSVGRLDADKLSARAERELAARARGDPEAVPGVDGLGLGALVDPGRLGRAPGCNVDHGFEYQPSAARWRLVPPSDEPHDGDQENGE